MINILRKNQKGLWIIIGLLCIPFVFYFSNSNVSGIRDENYGDFHGHRMTQVDFQRGARLLGLTGSLGMFDFRQNMTAGARSEEEATSQFTWNHLILHREAERLGIVPTGSEVAKVVKNFIPFRGEKGFEIEKYNQFTQDLPSLGFGEAQIEELAADQLTLERLQKVIGTGATVTEAELKENYERAYGKLSVAVLRISNDEIAKEIQVSDDEVTKYYEAQKENLKSEEKRQVSHVVFGLDEEQKKLAGKERVEVLQKVADRANDFSQALLEPEANFEQVAAKFQTPIVRDEPFTRASPPPAFAGNAPIVEAIFKLTPEQSNTDPLQVGDSFIIAHLVKTEPSQPLSLEQAKPKILEALKAQKVRTLATAKAATTAQALRQAIQSGTPLEAALQQTGMPVEKLPPFALADPPAMSVEPGQPPKPEAPEMQSIRGAMSELNPGGVSDVLPSANGSVIAVMEKREAPDAAKAATTLAMFEERVRSSKQDLAFYEWLRERQRDAGMPTTPEVTPDAG